MPNGGLDNCGTCIHFSGSRGLPRPGICTLRETEIEHDPYWTYCLNHHYHGDEHPTYETELRNRNVSTRSARVPSWLRRLWPGRRAPAAVLTPVGPIWIHAAGTMYERVPWKDEQGRLIEPGE